MKKNKLLALLFCVVAFASAAVAENGTAAGSVQNAVNVATDTKASIENVCKAVSGAVKDGAVAPSEVFIRVVAARQSWTTNQLAGLYKSVLLSSPALASSFMDDLDAFEAAGKPTEVSSEASEGVKLLAALYGVGVPGVNADSVLASVVADSVGPAALMTVSPLRDVGARAATQRRVHPTTPTPPVTSSEN